MFYLAAALLIVSQVIAVIYKVRYGYVQQGTSAAVRLAASTRSPLAPWNAIRWIVFYAVQINQDRELPYLGEPRDPVFNDLWRSSKIAGRFAFVATGLSFLLAFGLVFLPGPC